ncbi:MAG TPA: NAD(P)/FAD-dependent oxidoreductase, partial [Candidatus Sulfotelmatobacter sp.]|nr:NAD(P)/FAD-dependent oxidoreductase [Candidatus Sulfotelmatobacter sp.]
MPEKIPAVVIVGGGFGGLAAARRLKGAPVNVILIDRTNHHLFQPLLYQVATSVLAPGQIASPIRGILRSSSNTTVGLGTVTAVDLASKQIIFDRPDRVAIPVSYDYLILATGQTHSYFGHDEYEQYAPGLKSLADAVALRNKILTAFEMAEAEEDPTQHENLLTFVLVGAGPTGVELSAAIAIMIQSTLKGEFRRVNPMSARIVLIDLATRPLGTFAPELSEATLKRLMKLGVEVRLGKGVDSIDGEGVTVGGERIASKTVIWTAGVAPSPAGEWLKTETDRSGRVKIRPDLSVQGHPEVFVVGDTAFLEQDGKPLPGVAQVAIQQGRYAGELIRRKVAGRAAPGPFRYSDKGNLAVVGKGFAVLQSGKVHISGMLAWLVWAAVHLQFLAQSSLRVSVLVQWVWTYFTGQRGSRLIVNHHADRFVRNWHL